MPQRPYRDAIGPQSQFRHHPLFFRYFFNVLKMRALGKCPKIHVFQPESGAEPEKRLHFEPKTLNIPTFPASQRLSMSGCLMLNTCKRPLGLYEFGLPFLVCWRVVYCGLACCLLFVGLPFLMCRRVVFCLLACRPVLRLSKAKGVSVCATAGPAVLLSPVCQQPAAPFHLLK